MSITVTQTLQDISMGMLAVYQTIRQEAFQNKKISLEFPQDNLIQTMNREKFSTFFPLLPYILFRSNPLITYVLNRTKSMCPLVP